MKLISLNTYGGKVFGPLIQFISAHASTTDIFCFQEVLHTSQGAFVSHGARANLFDELKSILGNFDSFFAIMQEHYDLTTTVVENVDCRLVTFISKRYSIKETGEFFICNGYNSFIPNDYGTLPCKLHYTQFKVADTVLTICNIHGTSKPGDKLDSPQRLAQSQKIIDFITMQPGEKIVIGDFNLLPNTDSINMFERAGLRNLVKEHSIPTTRGSFNKILHPNYGIGPYGWQEFADYAFISGGITPLQFSVPDVPVSDHLPLILEFDLI